LDRKHAEVVARLSGYLEMEGKQKRGVREGGKVVSKDTSVQILFPSSNPH